MINGSALTTTMAYVHFTPGFPRTTPINNAPENASVKIDLNIVASDVEIIFLGAPVANAPDEADDIEPDNTRPEPRSHLSAPAVEIPPTDELIVVTAIVEDRNGNALEGSITYSVTFVEGSDLKSGQSSYSTRAMEFPGDENAGTTHSVSGWNDGTKPVAVEVSATFTGATGSITLPLVTVNDTTDVVKETKLTRMGGAAVIKAATFSVGCLVDGSEMATPANADDIFTPDDNDGCVMDARFGVNEVVVVKSHLEDALGSVVTGTLGVSLDEDVDDPLDKDFATPLNVQPTNTMVWLYTVDKDAMLGNHEITVSYAADEDVVEMVLNVAVAGPPMSYMISGPENIDLGGRGTFTVTAVDPNDGIPHFTMDDPDTMDMDESNNTVDVVVPDIAESLVRGSELDNGTLMLDAETGMGTFIIYAPSNAAGGSTARIFVSAGDVEITHTVTFGAATPGEGDMPTLMAPTNVAASSFGASKTVGVSWTPGSGAQQHIAVLFSSDGSIIVDVEYLGATADSHTFRDVASGDYLAVVASFRSGQMFMYDGFKAVTVQ